MGCGRDSRLLSNTWEHQRVSASICCIILGWAGLLSTETGCEMRAHANLKKKKMSWIYFLNLCLNGQGLPGAKNICLSERQNDDEPWRRTLHTATARQWTLLNHKYVNSNKTLIKLWMGSLLLFKMLCTFLNSLNFTTLLLNLYLLNPGKRGNSYSNEKCVQVFTSDIATLICHIHEKALGPNPSRIVQLWGKQLSHLKERRLPAGNSQHGNPSQSQQEQAQSNSQVDRLCQNSHRCTLNFSPVV